MVQGPVIIYSSRIKQTYYHLSPKVQTLWRELQTQTNKQGYPGYTVFPQ